MTKAVETRGFPFDTDETVLNVYELLPPSMEHDEELRRRHDEYVKPSHAKYLKTVLGIRDWKYGATRPQ